MCLCLITLWLSRPVFIGNETETHILLEVGRGILRLGEVGVLEVLEERLRGWTHWRMTPPPVWPVAASGIWLSVQPHLRSIELGDPWSVSSLLR